MTSRCDLTGKGKQYGHNVSFSLRRTKRTFKPNLQKKTFIVDGQKVTMTLSTQAIRTLKKKGILSPAKPAKTA
ncbi:50S ribosomal protein L28 [Candidatus Saccharibacteria bacterium]|nr:50S ribosomal protein L28 [Candidatus Saccharibacteria bacterium]